MTPGVGLASLPGTASRNGLPERRDYAYRGTGEDTLTAFLGRDTAAPARALPVNARVTAAPAPAVPEPVTLPRTALAICPACEAGVCDTCFGGPCLCPCIDYPPAVALAPAPEPAAPERCEVCGYLLTAAGHLLSCGTPDARRILRLAGAIGARP